MFYSIYTTYTGDAFSFDWQQVHAVSAMDHETCEHVNVRTETATFNQGKTKSQA